MTMAFKTVTDLSTDTMISLGGFNKKLGKTNPTSVEGYFLGARKVESNKAKSGYAFIYALQTSKGNVGVWGKTDLDRKMEIAKPGQMVRLSFDKMVSTPKGEMYKFKVEIDADNTIEVSTPVEASNSTGGNEEGDQEESNFSGGNAYEEDNNDFEAEEAAANAALAAAERKATVAALLKGNKGSSTRK